IQSATETFSFTNSWLANPNNNSVKIAQIIPVSNTVKAGIVRINHTNTSGFGKIATFRFQTNSSVSSNTTMNFSFGNLTAIDKDGISLPLNTLPYDITINSTSTSIANTDINQHFSIAPNPYTGNTNINYFISKSANVKLEITNTLGQVVQTIINENQTSGNYNYNFSANELGYKPGIYFARLIIDEKASVKKIIELE
ncbi:MAG: T9SS type A sorting domain-containing protein, partial [Bacteroidia bacterium]|nr:T9SS type A sorting domain-containing protein [Bacteroidia bacterium]